MSSSEFVNTLYYGDNLEVMKKHIKTESVDLIYLDPPFNSKADYNILFKEVTGEKSTAQIQAFSDFWHWDIEAIRAKEYLTIQGPEDVSNLSEALFQFLGPNDMTAYLVMMGIRLLELHRVLKPTGSIYLHCDPTASHYLKLVLDAIFGKENFRNEIIWKRTFAHGSANRWGDVHDVILFYSKTNNYTWTGLTQPHEEKYLDTKYRFNDDGGTYRLVVLTGPGTTAGPSGNEWRGYNPTVGGRHWAVPQRAIEELRKKGVEIPNDLHRQLDLLYDHGYIRFPQKKDGTAGVPEFKLYLDKKGGPIQDIITDIPPINSQAKERMGFPTQKPVALLERLIRASSNEGDIVLDPFCGCGTAIIASEKWHRNWMGIDITFLAINLIKNRLKDTYPNVIFKTEGEPKDLESARSLATESERDGRYQFQWWALSKIGAVAVGGTVVHPSVGKKGADKAVDGWLRFAEGEKGLGKILVQVKSGHVNVKDIREHRDALSSHNAAMGVFITLEEPTIPMLDEVKATAPYKSPVWNTEYPKIQIITIEQLLKGEKPNMPPTSNILREAPELKREKEIIQKKL